jgi:hypothetical protein
MSLRAATYDWCACANSGAEPINVPPAFMKEVLVNVFGRRFELGAFEHAVPPARIGAYCDRRNSRARRRRERRLEI